MPTLLARALISVVPVAVLAGACSAEVSVGGDGTGPAEEAEALIEGQLADEAGLGPLTADCPDTDDVEPGATFECTGTTEDGEVVRFTATVTDDGTGEVNSTNLATPDDITQLAAEGARVLSEQNGVELPADAVACDDSRGFVFSVGATLDCQVTDPQTGDVLAAVITISDPETGAFEIQITG